MPRAVSFFTGFVPALLLASAGWPLVKRNLALAGCLITNYRGKMVVNCAGLLVPLAYAAMALLFALLRIGHLSAFRPFLFMVLAASFFGLLDDLWGSGSSKGFKGHFGSLFEGRLTTGVVKAAGVGVAALLVAGMRSPSWPLLLLDAALVALSVNVMNLFDLRPGRALKVFLIGGAAVALTASSANIAAVAIGLALAFILLPGDLGERSMLGDVGSNAFGAVIGVGFMINFNWPAKLALLVLLLTIQLYAERFSITELIGRVAVLRKLDELGRER